MPQDYSLFRLQYFFLNFKSTIINYSINNLRVYQQPLCKPIVIYKAINNNNRNNRTSSTVLPIPIYTVYTYLSVYLIIIIYKKKTLSKQY